MEDPFNVAKPSKGKQFETFGYNIQEIDNNLQPLESHNKMAFIRNQFKNDIDQITKNMFKDLKVNTNADIPKEFQTVEKAISNIHENLQKMSDLSGIKQLEEYYNDNDPKNKSNPRKKTA